MRDSTRAKLKIARDVAPYVSTWKELEDECDLTRSTLMRYGVHPGEGNPGAILEMATMNAGLTDAVVISPFSKEVPRISQLDDEYIPLTNKIAALAASKYAAHSLHSPVRMAAEQLCGVGGHPASEAVIMSALVEDPDGRMGTAELLGSLADKFICVQHKRGHAHYGVVGGHQRLAGTPIGHVSMVTETDKCACGSEIERKEDENSLLDRYVCADTSITILWDRERGNCEADLQLPSAWESDCG